MTDATATPYGNKCALRLPHTEAARSTGPLRRMRRAAAAPVGRSGPDSVALACRAEPVRERERRVEQRGAAGAEDRDRVRSRAGGGEVRDHLTEECAELARVPGPADRDRDARVAGQDVDDELLVGRHVVD